VFTGAGPHYSSTRPVDTGDRYIYYPCLEAVDTARVPESTRERIPGSRVLGIHYPCSRAGFTGAGPHYPWTRPVDTAREHG